MKSALVLSAFTAFIIPPGSGWIALPLKARYGCATVIRLMLTFVDRAGEHELTRRHGLALSRPFGAVKGEQNGSVALPAANAEIPPHIGLGPLRDIHKVLLWDWN